MKNKIYKMRIKELINYITPSIGIHKNNSVIWCQFKKEPELIKQFKLQFPFAKWSSSQKCWYVLDRVELRKRLGLVLKSPEDSIHNSIHDVNKPALKKMATSLKLRAYSANTNKVYINEFAQLLRILKNNSVDTLTPDRLKAYLLYCINVQKLSDNHLQSRLNAIKFYFEKVLKRDKFFFDIPRPKRPSKLPKVIDVKDVKRLLDVTTNIKHNLMLKLCYGMGLRVSEIVTIKISNIDSKRMQVMVENSKGKKDRYVTLPASVLSQLRQYYKEYKPKEFLFEGQYGGTYSIRSVQAVFKKAMLLAKVNKTVGIHALRHSYATHLLEQGTDIAYIQKLLGHKDIKTTLLYTKVSNKQLTKIKSPLDQLF